MSRGVNLATTLIEMVAVDFGSGNEGTDIDVTLAIENTGTADLTISSIVSSGTDFSILGTPPSLIAPAATSTFVIRLSGITAGTFNSTVTINSDDGDEAVFDFPVTGIISN